MCKLKNLFKNRPSWATSPAGVNAITPTSDVEKGKFMKENNENKGSYKHPDFVYLWNNLTIDKNREEQVHDVCSRIMAYKKKYEKVAKIGAEKAKQYFTNKTEDEINTKNIETIPWWYIAALHYRESNCDFDRILQNGQKIIGTGKVTTWVPKGRGPFNSWAESAVDALFVLKGYETFRTWSIYDCIARAERYNGLGYRYRIGDHGHAEYSPYLFSGTNFSDETGKFYFDGKYKANMIDKQIGVCAVWLGLKEKFYVDIR